MNCLLNHEVLVTSCMKLQACMHGVQMIYFSIKHTRKNVRTQCES